MLNFEKPWDQKLADIIVKFLRKSSVTPNQVTFFSLFLAITGSTLLTFDNTLYINIGAALFIVARFLDHIDGELAREKNMTSQLGYYLDYLTGGLSYATLFICLGLQFNSGFLNIWALFLGFLGALSALTSLFLNLRIDRESSDIDQSKGESIGYPSFFGFELEDGIYLLAPITWLGWLEPFFILSSIGAVIYGIWTLFNLTKIQLKKLNL